MSIRRAAGCEKYGQCLNSRSERAMYIQRVYAATLDFHKKSTWKAVSAAGPMTCAHACCRTLKSYTDTLTQGQTIQPGAGQRAPFRSSNCTCIYLYMNTRIIVARFHLHHTLASFRCGRAQKRDLWRDCKSTNGVGPCGKRVQWIRIPHALVAGVETIMSQQPSLYFIKMRRSRRASD